MGKFEVIYEQSTIYHTKYIVECDNEDTLVSVLDSIEDEMKNRGFDTFDDLYYLMKKNKLVNVVEVNEYYQEDWDAPEYYDHRKIDD